MSPTYPYAAAAALALLIGGVGSTAARADSAPATDLYVNGASPQCLNSGPGTAAVPFCDLQAAADAVVAGETVQVTPTTTPYQPFTVTSSGTAAQPIRFVYAPSASGTGPTAVEVQSSASTAITVSGAQYVSFSGFEAYGLGQTALSLTGAGHVSFDSGMLVSTHAGTATTAQPNAVEIDGTSSAITLSGNRVPQAPGWAVDAQPGAADIVVTDDYIYPAQGLGGVHADGVNGIVVTADSIHANCGSAVDIEGDSSGSIENLVAQNAGSAPDTGTALCAGKGPAAEINVSATAAPDVVSDYNAVQANLFGVDYQWAGSPYTTSQAFNQNTTQGAHDLDTMGTYDSTGAIKEDSVIIDSGDADAPDEPATDILGRPRVDDPLIANTGTGDGYVDRGAFEFQNPLAFTGLTGTPTQGPGPFQVTATAGIVNPWNTQGVRYSFSFGDSTPASTPSTSVTAEHTYAAVTSSTQYYISATAQLPDGSTRHDGANGVVTVNPQAPLVPVIDAATAADQPDSAMLSFSATSPWTITDSVVDFGDTSRLQFPGSTQALWHPYPAPGTYTVTDTVTDQGGNTVTVSKQVTVGLSFTGISPQRVLDTRYGTGAPKQPVGAGGVVRVKITGVDGIPRTGVSAVTMNVTDAHATASSWITAYADGSPRPNASNLNFGAGQTNPNLITVPVGSDGYVDLWNANGKVDLFADVQGFYTTFSSSAFASDHFAPSTPTRVLDTRYGTGAPKRPVGPGSVTTVTLPAASAQANDVVLNITETSATADSWVTVYPGFTYGRPDSSSLNFGPGRTTSNLVVVPLLDNGPQTVRIYNNAGQVNLFADVQGYYENGPGTTAYVPVTPTRVVDTRYGTGAPKQPIGPGGTLRIKVTGIQGVPQGTAAVLLNLTGTRPTASTWLTAYANGATPSTSDIDLVPGQTRPVLAVVPVDPEGCITIANARGTTDVFADLEGYFG